MVLFVLFIVWMIVQHCVDQPFSAGVTSGDWFLLIEY